MTTRMILLVSILMAPSLTALAAPTIYSLPGYQSPVRADADDLLLLPGYGFAPTDVVVYVKLENTTLPLSPPTSAPATNTALTGIADIVSAVDTPHSLTIRLPQMMANDQSYALWVRDTQGEWSNGVRINDARPLWFSPSRLPASGGVASLPRYLKVIGRNLQSAPGQTTRVRLTGHAAAYTLDAIDDGDPATAIERYAAIVNLPEDMAADSYAVEVSRDATSWVSVPDQTLTIADVAPASPEHPVSNYGGCQPNDGNDDTSCIIGAIAAAKAAGGGTVVFGPGIWNMIDSAATGITRDGILVPVGVSLRGAGSAQTTIERGAGWALQLPYKPPASFALQGRNTVDGFTFRDARVYQPSDAAAGTILMLGKRYDRADPSDPSDPKVVADVTIMRNVFDRAFVAVSAGGLPIERLYVTGNEIGAYHSGIALSGNQFNVMYPYRIDDSIIADNNFQPGSYMDVSIRQGVLASQLGAGRRVDFSGNSADGTSTAYLYDPVNDARGWRAGFFWNLRSGQQMLLASNNVITCAGDKTGDGEAIAYDNNNNHFALPRAQTVLDVSANSVVIQGPLKSVQQQVTVPSDHYVGHWVHIAEGRGVGQVRPIVAYSTDPLSGLVTLTVAPAWEVLPEISSSRVTIAREYWQVYTVDNISDQRAPRCLKSNRTPTSSTPVSGGTISIWGQTTDSALEGNRLYDTTGITLHHTYTAEDSACPSCISSTGFMNFVEVRDNTLDHEYAWNTDCSRAGISGSHGASPTPSSPPPIASYGVTIAHNDIVRSDGYTGGSITFPLTWYAGPAPNNWKLIHNALVHHNNIADLPGTLPPHQCGGSAPGNPRLGIQLQNPLVWNTVLYANTCANVAKALNDAGTGTVRVCPSPTGNSCECPPPDVDN